MHIRVGNSDATSSEVIFGELTEGQNVVVGTVTPPERSLLGLRIGF